MQLGCGHSHSTYRKQLRVSQPFRLERQLVYDHLLEMHYSWEIHFNNPVDSGDSVEQ